MSRFYFAGSLLLCFVALSFASFAGTGDTTHVITHNAITVVTNPNAGVNNYEAWGVFPGQSTKYRKIILTLHYECPTGMACGEWDYIDAVSIRRTGGISGTSADLEIARYITPYGNTFSQTWFSEFKIDVTDFALFLHDSVEIEYQHGGYETNVGKGWAVTVDFACIEGSPIMEPIAITKLWNGSFPFGNASNPIEDYLVPIPFTTNESTQLARLRIVQSGHGYDDHQCAEFCTKKRYLYFDSTLEDTRDIWKKCGDNPIFPQGGTWIYDRANWCPGLPVIPDVYDFTVEGNSPHEVNIDMQAYTSNAPSANYYLMSQLIEFKLPEYANDAAIEDVYTPSNQFEYHRMNPICNNPHIVLKNNGNQPLTSATIYYGLEGLSTYEFDWTGNLATNQKEEVVLANLVTPDATHSTFQVYLGKVNNTTDEYVYDDTVRSTALIPATMDSVFVFYIKTNNNSFENSYTMTNEEGTVLYERAQFSMDDNTTYKDTMQLAPGCYTLKFNDTGGDGLYFWANPYQGTGSAKFTKMNGVPIKVFTADFGNEFVYNFTVAESVTGTGDVVTANEMVETFPNPSNGSFTTEILLKKPEAVTVRIWNQVGQQVYGVDAGLLQHEFLEVNLEDVPAGYYMMQVKTGSKTFVKKISIVR
jgi:hypothetical protein